MEIDEVFWFATASVIIAFKAFLFKFFLSSLAFIKKIKIFSEQGQNGIFFGLNHLDVS